MSHYLSNATRLAAVTLLFLATPLAAQENEAASPAPLTGYLIQPGDLLEISVWKEDYLERDILVRPDGGVTFPLAGDVLAAGRTVADVQAQITVQLSRFIPDPVVTVSLKEIRGNKIYVLGQVQKPGAFVMNPRVDVMQALALAGGTTPFANTNDIKILRRTADRQEVIDFRYSEVEKGRKLAQNIILKSGDIIVVP
jgi:polysaccharide export outer membrane protein